MHRRALLTTAGVTLLGGCSELLGGESEDDTERRPAWEKRADRAIRANRTAPLDVLVTDASGNPVPNADVGVEMRAHDFQFGTAVDATKLLRGEDDRYRKHLSEHFNAAVLEHRHKWKPWETDRETADRATEWLLDRGLDVRGHTVVWQEFNHDVVPDDVTAKLGSDDPERAEYLSERTRGHVRDIVDHYSGRITDWDLLNEHLDKYRITEAIAPGALPQESPPPVEWFETAAEVAPDAGLYVNDYDLITGGDESRHEAIETLITHLQDSGAPIHGVGFQGHFGAREETIDPAELRRLLDRFASLGVDLKITEYDTFGPGWTEQTEAEYLAVVLKTLFANPAAEGFLMWGFWDGAHWKDDATLFRDDWSKKPAFDAYADLVYDEWWTDENGVTDEDGRYRTRAFLGEHEITAFDSGDSASVEATITDPAEASLVTVQIRQ